MEIETEDLGACSVMRPAGRVDSHSAPVLDRAIAQLFDGGVCALLMDLSKLDYISSAGLRSVLIAAKRARGVKGKLVLTGLKPQVAEVFQIGGFTQLLSICPDLNAALILFDHHKESPWSP